jgi:mRNA interferase RelE/StbE
VSAYALSYTPQALKDIQGLDPVVRKRLGKKLLQMAEDPQRFAGKLTNSTLGAYRFRIGDHRVIFDLKGKAIIVLHVGHRREIYR